MVVSGLREILYQLGTQFLAAGQTFLRDPEDGDNAAVAHQVRQRGLLGGAQGTLGGVGGQEGGGWALGLRRWALGVGGWALGWKTISVRARRWLFPDPNAQCPTPNA
jgi:hypothetical protein